MEKKNIEEIISKVKDKKNDISNEFIDRFTKILESINNEPNAIIYTDDYVEFNWNQDKLKYNVQYLQLNFYYDNNISCIVQSSSIKVMDNVQNCLLLIERTVKK